MNSIMSQEDTNGIPTDRITPSKARQYKRAYKACLWCRKSKSKCELPRALDGTAVSSGPCFKCRRERKECSFTETRGTKKRLNRGRSHTSELQRGESGRNGYSRQESELYSRLHTSVSPEERNRELTIASQGSTSGSPMNVPGLSNGKEPENLNDRSEHSHSRTQSISQRPLLDDVMMRTIVTSSHDALGLLFQAAEQQNESSRSETPAHAMNEQSLLRNSTQLPTPRSTLSGAGPGPVFPDTLSNASPEVLRLWSRCRFVKQGWFSAREAITYIDLFVQNCAPMTPVLTREYADHTSHCDLLTNEPLLTSIILTISSRVHILPGMGGTARAHFIHGRLWEHTEHLISRIIFGQEKSSSAKTRTIGTIEGFLLITEWNPRAVHFPPRADGWDADLLKTDDLHTDSSPMDDESTMYRWREEVIEPAKRSDRMSWMLLSAAVALAHELGIFSDEAHIEDQRSASETTRRRRIPMLLYVYVSQLAARLRCTSLFPENSSISLLDKMSLPLMTPTEKQWHSFMSLFIDITKLMETATEMFFPNTSRQILLSGQYKGFVKHFQSLLAQWHQRLVDTKGDLNQQGGHPSSTIAFGLIFSYRIALILLRHNFCRIPLHAHVHQLALDPGCRRESSSSLK